MKNLRYNNNLLSGIYAELSRSKGGLGKVFTILCLLMASVGAWAQTYVFITNETNGYFLGLNNGNAVATQTFTTGSCVWTASGTLNNTYNRTLRINTSYLDGANSNSGTVSIGNTRNGYWRGNNNQLYYNRTNNRPVYRDDRQVKWTNATPNNVFRIYTSYTTTAEEFTVANITGINDLVTAKGTYNLVSAASYNPTYYTFTGPDTRYYAADYTTGAVTTRPVKTTGFTSDTWSLNKTIPGLSISDTGVLTYNTYVTEDTQVTITHTVRENGQTKTATRTITLKGTIETSLSFASTSLNMTATTLSLPAVNLTASNGSTPPGSVTYSSNNTGCISVSNTGVLTINGAGTATITANYAANGDYLASSATMTITVANTAALDETVVGDMTITPSSQTLDLGQQVTYTASESINNTHRTRPAYTTISTGGNNYYKVGANYQAAAPNTNEDKTPIRFTSFSWSAAEGGAYFTLAPYYSASSNKVTLTRSAQKTGTQQTFTISVTGVYGSQNKTASATVTIPATQVDLTALHAGEALNLGVGETGTLEGHYTYEPDYDAAGAAYKKFTYTSANTNVATVDESGKVTAVGPGTTTITVQSMKINGDVNTGVSCAITVNVSISAPKISIDKDGNVTIEDTNGAAGVQIRYTTNGTDPTATTGTVYNAAFGPVANETTVKAVAVANGVASAVTSQTYVTSGISGGKVILNDYEDHNWTYYQPNGGVDASYAYPDQLCSPYPRNAKITYYGNGTNTVSTSNNATPADNTFTASTNNNVAVSRYETENTFVYYKTLEREGTTGRFPYELIPNPFSKRPTYGTDGTTKWRGFYGWRIKSISGGTIHSAATGGTQYNVGSIITAEYATLYFQPTDNGMTNANNATSMEVEFEAVWARAYRVESTAANTNTNMSSNTLAANSYERNFVVVTSGTSATNLTGGNKPCTVTMIEPDGSQDYRGTGGVYLNPQYIMAQNNWKFEWINLRNNNNTTISANGKNLVLGRGLMQGGANHTAGDGYGTPGTNLCAAYVNGLGNGTSAGYNTYNTNLDFVVRIESGFYTEIGYLAAARGRYGCTSALIHVKGFFGNDYDRAAKNNARLISAGGTGQPAVCLGDNNNAAIATDNHQNYNKETLFLNVKSGLIGNGTPAGWAPGNNGLYLGSALGNAQTCGNRQLLFEGGRILSITGGMDRTANNSTAAADNTAETVRMRFKGTAEVLTAAYGGAAQMPTYGKRILIYTGGLVHGWTATGCNGIAASQGQNRGIGYMYVGGNTRIGDGTLGNINGTGRGIVMGAGNGRSDSETTGEMTHGSYVVVADKAEIENEVYGGGNYGYTLSTAHVYITGGTINGSVFGGSLRKQGDDAEIYMTGGEVKKGIYGGSNTNGTFSGSVTMHIDGGYVGTEDAPANIHGGGYGQPTRINKNIDISVGKLGSTNGALIYGDVYGGSALGYVNGTAATTTYHTNVTLNAGTINGSLYGGGLGNASNAADVYGPVQVKVYGGSVKTTSVEGSGAVYGCNNVNGAPQRAVTVDIYNTDAHDDNGSADDYSDDKYAIDAVYGGGNRANYTFGTPTVTVHNCDNSIQYVYGGGNQATVPGTNVTIKGGNIIGNVFGGGNNANVTTNGTQVTINGGRILNVYGGNNNGGEITGDVRVNVAEPANSTCPVDVTDLYGGGNLAASKAGQINIGKCHNISNVYGGANQANVTGPITLNITDGCIGTVFGGNNNSGTITEAITVNVNWGASALTGVQASLGNVYGGGNKAAYTGSPTVNITNVTTTGSVFGGGLGTTAIVTGNPQVNIGSWTEGKVVIGGDVFGGGDLAAVEGGPTVVVKDCQTIIKGDLYGGGNAAPVHSTNTTMWGGSVWGNAFGGGNGADPSKNAKGAQVGYKSDDTTKAGSGDATMKIYGGTIGVWNGDECTAGGGIFGGSNTNGNIAGKVNLTINQQKDGTYGCDLKLKELYGAGNKAAYTGTGINFNLGCVDYLEEIYGGAKQADLNTDAVLNITSGRFKRVFGGNNLGGNLNGSITVNIKETGCNPIVIDELYGCGNQAAYTTPNGKPHPVVNVISCTHIGQVFGGGYGASATVTGNPTVSIQEVLGDFPKRHYNVNDKTVSAGTSGEADELGSIGTVFGGGNEAKVIGSTNILVATEAGKGAYITGNVYGGGNQADVTGKTNVTIGQDPQP